MCLLCLPAATSAGVPGRQCIHLHRSVVVSFNWLPQSGGGGVETDHLTPANILHHRLAIKWEQVSKWEANSGIILGEWIASNDLADSINNCFQCVSATCMYRPLSAAEHFCVQLTKAYMAETSCNQLLIKSGMSVIMIYLHMCYLTLHLV